MNMCLILDYVKILWPATWLGCLEMGLSIIRPDES